MSRRRKIIMWMSIVSTVLLLAVWVGSAWWGWIALLGQDGILHVCCGRLGIYGTISSPVFDDGIYRIEEPYTGLTQLEWWFELFRAPYSGLSFRGVLIPIWFFALLTSIPGILIWRRERRRSRVGLCAKCGYDLRGSAAGARCPECGVVAGAAGVGGVAGERGSGGVGASSG